MERVVEGLCRTRERQDGTRTSVYVPITKLASGVPVRATPAGISTLSLTLPPEPAEPEAMISWIDVSEAW